MKRILVMEFIKGCSISDVEGMTKMGLNIKEVSYLAKEIFVFLFV